MFEEFARQQLKDEASAEDIKMECPDTEWKRKRGQN